MEWNKQQTVTRLAVCVVIAVVLYTLLDKAGDRLPALEPYLPWLEKNKVQAIAIAAAILFGLSLAVLPPTETPELHPAEPDPCEGYEPV